MKVVVTPNPKMPIRGLLSRPLASETVLDLTEMQIKRVLNNGAKVHVTSLDGIKAEITLANGELNTDEIKSMIDKVEVTSDTLVGESDHPTDNSNAEVLLVAVAPEEKQVEEPEAIEEESVNDEVAEVSADGKPDYQHMSKAQRKAARRAEAQQRAAEEAAKKEAEQQVEEVVEETTECTTVEPETVEEATAETVDEEDAAKENAEVISSGEESVEE